MNKIQGIHVFILLLMGMLLSAGCTMSPPAPVPIAENQDIPRTQPLLLATNLPLAPLATVPCPQENTSSFINISSIPDPYIGDITTFNGTTNLPPGETITVAISIDEIRGCQKTRYPCKDPDTVYNICCEGGFKRQIPLTPGNCGINSWSLTVNTSQHDFYPARFNIFAISRNTSIHNEMVFTILEKPKAESSL